MSVTKAGILVGLVSLFGFAFAAILFFYSISPYVDRRVIPFSHSAIKDTLIFGSAGVCCLFVSIKLIAGRRWAWWTTVVFSALGLLGGIFLLWVTMHPRDDFARSEGGFGVFLSILTTVPSALCFGILNLPAVRKRFFFRVTEGAS